VRYDIYIYTSLGAKGLKDGLKKTENYEHNAGSVLFLFIKDDSVVTFVSVRES
jgi:hypothetical protein